MIRKAVIPAAGLGTRFLPATKSMPKEMLPIIDKPVIQFAVEEAVASGVDDIIIITGRGKRAIEDYFDTSPEIEHHLFQNKKYELLKKIRDISSLADIHYIRQKEPLGLGDAVLKAEKHIGNEVFTVLLGDDIIVSEEPAIGQLIRCYQRVNSSVIAVEEIPSEICYKYGIVEVEKQRNLLLAKNLIEKPEKAPSNLAIIGRYVLTPEIFDCLKNVRPDSSGEIQLTDALNLLRTNQKIYVQKVTGKRYDIGDKLSYVKAIIDFSLQRDDIGKDVRDYLGFKFS